MNGRLFGGRPWVPALVVLPMFAGFALGGVQAGTAIGALTMAGVIYLAIRAESDGPIEIAAPSAGVPGGIMVLLLAPIEDPRTAAIIAEIGDPSRPEAGAKGLLMLAPACSTTLDRWADDLEGARFESQRILAVSMASLAAAGIEAEGRVGDGDLVQAAEDALRSFAATEVAVVVLEGAAKRPIAILERRLERPLRRVEPSP